MTTIELTAEVGLDHRLIVDVPLTCPPGRHRLLLLVDSPNETNDVVAPTVPQGNATIEPLQGPFAWEGGVLVYTGQWLGIPTEDVVTRERDLRMNEILGEVADADSR